MSIFIFSDSTADFNSDLLKQFKDVELLPLSYSLDEDDYDGIETSIPIAEFYKRVEAGAVTKTSMTSTYYMEERMTDILEKGYDVLVDAFSGGLSNQYEGTLTVVTKLKKKYPERKIETIDSTLASAGEALHLYKVLKKRDEGVSFEELVQYAKELRRHIASYFTVTDLRHLARLGRCSMVSAFIGSIVKIMPVLYVNPLGKLISYGKVISRKKAIKALFEKMGEKMVPIEKQDKVFISHAACLEDAQYLASLVKEKYGIEVVISDISQVIGSHTSSGCLAFFFECEDRFDPDDKAQYTMDYSK